MAGTAANVAAQTVLPGFIGQTGTDIVTGTMNHYASFVTPASTKVGHASQANTPAFDPIDETQQLKSTVAIYRNTYLEREQQIKDYQREIARIKWENQKLQYAQLSASQEAMALADKYEQAAKTSTDLQRTVQHQSEEIYAMKLALDQVKAAQEQAAAQRAESRRVTPSSSPIIIIKDKPATSPRSSSFLQGMSNKVHQATSILANATSKIVKPAIFGPTSRTVSPKAPANKPGKELTPPNIQDNITKASETVVMGTPVSSHMTRAPPTSQNQEIFSPSMRSGNQTKLPLPKMANQGEVKEEPSAPMLPLSHPAPVQCNQHVANTIEPIDTKRHSKERVSTPHTHSHPSHAPVRHTHTLPPAVQLEEPSRHHITNTSYQPQEVIGSNKPSATLSENNLRLHTTSNQQPNVQHFVNPMLQQFETDRMKPIIDTPPNQGNRKQVGRTPESFLDEQTPQSDKPLLNKKHHLSAEIQTYQPHNQSSKVSHYVQRYQEIKTEEKVQRSNTRESMQTSKTRIKKMPKVSNPKEDQRVGHNTRRKNPKRILPRKHQRNHPLTKEGEVVEVMEVVVMEVVVMKVVVIGVMMVVVVVMEAPQAKRVTLPLGLLPTHQEHPLGRENPNHIPTKL
jgi:hypothetical protein